MSSPETALVLEDQAETREHLLAALSEAFPGVVARGAGDLAEARSFLDGGGLPDLALVDLGLPDGRGVDFLRDLAERSGGATRSVVVTIYADDAHLFDAIAAGAGGYLLKDMGRADLVRYLRRLEAGETPLSPGMCAGFRSGTGDAHHLVNRSNADVVYLEIGDRNPGDGACYPDDDLQATFEAGQWVFKHRNGVPY